MVLMRLTRQAASAAVTPLGWRFVLGSLCCQVPSVALADLVTLAGAATGSNLLIDVRGDVALLTLRARDGGVTPVETALAAQISSLVPASPGAPARSVQLLELAIDAIDIDSVRPFWRAVLAYTDQADGSLCDPYGQGPAIWFQQMDEPRPQRNRIHFDVSVPHDEAGQRIAATLAEMRRQTRFAPHLTYQPAGGSMAERGVVSAWLGTRVPGLARERVLVAPGTQAVLMALLLTLTRPGDTVLTEALTYPGLKAVARLARVTLVGVAMDAHGMEPHALAAAGRRFKPKVVVLTPTMHNPTTATMPAARREQIADVVVRQRLTLIEDDPYLFLDTSVAPLAALIPERTYLAASLSKCLAPGLRTSLVVAPDTEAARDAAAALHGVAQMPAPLMTAIVLRWLRDGRADAIIDAVRAEAAARQTLARDVLGALAPSRAETASPHLWLPSPDASSSDRFGEMLRGRGLGVVASGAFAVAEDGPQGVRLALGAARNRAELKSALTILRQVVGAHSQSA